MTEEQAEKLDDYLSGLRELSDDALSPIGAILVEDRDREATLGAVKEAGFAVVENPESHPGITEILKNIRSGIPVALAIASSPAPTLRNLLSGFTHGSIILARTNASVRGAADSDVMINPVPKSAKIVFVLTEECYGASAALNRIITSACRIAA